MQETYFLRSVDFFGKEIDKFYKLFISFFILKSLGLNSFWRPKLSLVVMKSIKTCRHFTYSSRNLKQFRGLAFTSFKGMPHAASYNISILYFFLVDSLLNFVLQEKFPLFR
jgi:hypothetical protein